MRKRALFSFTISLFSAAVARADVKPASIFQNHMVLQQGMAIPIWGTADAGEKISIAMDDQATKTGELPSATTDAAGHWRINLAKQEYGGPHTIVIQGKNTITFTDVLIGEVWVGSGQSNMTFPISNKVASYAGMLDEDKVIAAADHPDIRMFTGASTKALEPQSSLRGTWEVCSPATAPHFSAIGYLFARNLNRELKVPVGIVVVAEGASSAESWISRDAMAADDKLKYKLDRFDALVKFYQENPTAPASAAPPAPHTINSAPPRPAGAAPASRPAQATRPGGATRPAGGRAGRGGGGGPVQDHHEPTVMYNGMIAPIIPYAMRGVIWYQGESIVDGTPGIKLYPEIQSTLISNWRNKWGQGDFPFYICQLAAQDNTSNNPLVLEMQATVLKLKNTGMAVLLDTGEIRNVHPKNKEPAGDRLSRIALANVYGKPIAFSGPLYDSQAIQGSSIHVKFTHAQGLHGRGGNLKWFEIAGEDGKFVPAKATVDGDSVVVTSPDVAAPKYVRYAWNRWPEGANLVNGDDLPSGPFRTDDLEFVPEGVVE